MEPELSSLQESVHSLAEAMKLLPDIYQLQGAAFNSEPYQKFTKIIDDVLAKAILRPRANGCRKIAVCGSHNPTKSHSNCVSTEHELQRTETIPTT